MINVRVTCRACDSPLVLEPILDLGLQRLNDFPRTLHDLETVQKVPLELMLCPTCSLVQLRHTVPPDWMYKTYWYRSGVNEVMIEELLRVVREARALVDLEPGDAVLDIGANDGTLLSHYPDELKLLRIAVEPARNLHSLLAKHTDVLVGEYFPTTELAPQAGKVKILSAVAMCYDLEHPRAFFQQIRELLHPEGVAVLQFQDLLQQIQCAAFDNICHEHLEYYTLGSLLQLVRGAGLEVVRCAPSPINGGSLRVHLRHASHVMKRGVNDRTVTQQLLAEEAMGLGVAQIRGGERRAFDQFRWRITNAKRQIVATLAGARLQGKSIDVYGASTKGNITLQVLGIGPTRVRWAVDRNPDKWGKFTITGIPIVGELVARADPADVWFCAIWQFRDAVLKRERKYLEAGGTILFPLPHAEIVQEGW